MVLRQLKFYFFARNRSYGFRVGIIAVSIELVKKN
jgi:hypothetical protein